MRSEEEESIIKRLKVGKTKVWTLENICKIHLKYTFISLIFFEKQSDHI